MAMSGPATLPDISRLSIAERSSIGVVDCRKVLKRPSSRGTVGRPVDLFANYFSLTLPSQPYPFVLRRYDIKVDPPVKKSVENLEAAIAQQIRGGKPGPTGKKLQQVIKLFLEDGRLKIHKEHGLFTDFKAQLYSRRVIVEYQKALFVEYRAENSDQVSDDPLVYKVWITPSKRKTLNISSLTTDLGSDDLNLVQDAREELIQALNIMLLHYGRSSTKHYSIGSRRSFLKIRDNAIDGTDYKDLGGGLRALRGAFSSVHVVNSGLLVNANLSHGAFYSAVDLPTLMSAYDTNYRFNLRPLEVFLKNLRVGLTHLKDAANNPIAPEKKIKTIVGFARKGDGVLPKDEIARAKKYKPPILNVDHGAKPGQVQFWYESGSNGYYITVSQYYKQCHNITVNETLPVVNVGSVKIPIYQAAEFCTVMPGQPCKSKLNGAQTTKMIGFAVRDSSDTRRWIQDEGMRTLGLTNPEHQLSTFNIQASTQMISIKSRTLFAPKILYKKSSPRSVARGEWNMTDGQHFCEEGTLEDWSFVSISYRNNYGFDKVKKAVADFLKVAEASGIKVKKVANSPEQLVIRHVNDESLKTRLKKYRDTNKVKFLLVVLPSKDIPLYNRIKRIGDIELGIPTVCVIYSKFCDNGATDRSGEPKVTQTYANVALKVNLKLGGINHQVDGPDLGIINQNKTMVVGIDVTHPSPGSEEGCPSVAAMVASKDEKLGQWPAVLSLQYLTNLTRLEPSEREAANRKLDPRQEMVSEIASMLQSRLKVWQDNHKQALPENILIYRDGVSEGQYEAVLEEELKPMEEKCKELYHPLAPPRITLIVVAKRHHTRFFTVNNKDSDVKGSPRNGTVVDSGVTDDRIWDFFLQSHTPLQGTARPGHYIVLKNQIFTKGSDGPIRCKNIADAVEGITYNLCWLYGRATKSVSYCPAAYYADRACDRARCYLSRFFDRDTMDAGAQGATREHVTVHKDLKDSMFYI